MSDCPQLVPLVDAVRANLGRKPREIRRTRAIAARTICWRPRPGRSTPMSLPGEPSIRPRPLRKAGGGMTQKMRQKLKRRRLSQPVPIAKADRGAGVRADCQQGRGFRQFPAGVALGPCRQAEWALICTAHNIAKLAKAIWGLAFLWRIRRADWVDGRLKSFLKKGGGCYSA